jgi:hypothetical protein
MFFKKVRGALWVCLWNQGGGGPKKFGNHWCKWRSFSLCNFSVRLLKFSSFVVSYFQEVTRTVNFKPWGFLSHRIHLGGGGGGLPAAVNLSALQPERNLVLRWFLRIRYVTRKLGSRHGYNQQLAERDVWLGPCCISWCVLRITALNTDKLYDMTVIKAEDPTLRGSADCELR